MNIHDNNFPGNPKYESVITEDVRRELMRPRYPSLPKKQPPFVYSEAEGRRWLIECGIMLAISILIIGFWAFSIIRTVTSPDYKPPTQEEMAESDRSDWEEAQLEHD